MSRNSNFILVGSLWTLTSVLFFFQLLYPTVVVGSAGAPLAGSLIVASIFFFMAAISRSSALGQAAVSLHMAIPLCWVYWVAAGAGMSLGFSSWFALGICGMVGAALCDHGVEKEREACGMEAEQKTVTVAKTTSFVRPNLAACDSGAFRLP